MNDDRRHKLQQRATQEALRIRGEAAYLQRTQKWHKPMGQYPSQHVLHQSSFVRGALFAFDLLTKPRQQD